MSSYYPSFNYMGFNSLKDKKLMVVAFEADQGEVDTFLGMDPVYTEKYDGSSRLDYGAKFNSVAMIKISVVKTNKSDFTVAEVRDFLKWTTGIRSNSYLDLLIGDEIKFSFICRATSVYQQKFDARTVGMTIEFTSTSPWAYSPIQYVGYSLDQSLSVDDNGVVYNTENVSSLKVDDNGVLYNTSLFSIENDGTIYIDDSSVLRINNETDDLYTPVYLNTVFVNGNSTSLSIKNITLDEETTISNINGNEVITLSENQFILSDMASKIFGNDFNFVWPKLGPGINDFIISSDGTGSVEFSYRYPIKIGDCAIDIDMLMGIDCDNNYTPDDGTSSGGGNNDSSGTISGKVPWSNITNTPTTLAGYGIKNAYTMTQVDQKVEEVDINIDEAELNKMLSDILT